MGGQTGDRAPPSQQSSAQRCHCAHRFVTVWGFSARGSSSWARLRLVAGSPGVSSLGPFCLCHPNRGLALVWGRDGSFEILVCLSVLQGASTSERTSERENLSREGRFLGSAFEGFCSGCLDALLPALINVSGGKLPPVPHSLSKEGKEAV